MSLFLYLLRHGQTTHSRSNDFCGSLDVDLTEDGMAMATDFANAYDKHPWKAIYSSPMKRTRATAADLARRVGIDPQYRDGLREIEYGAWEGRTVEQVDREFHDDYVRWTADPAWNAPTGGELASTIASRALAVIEEVRETHRTGSVLLVSHKATIRIVLCSLLGIDVGRFRYRFACPVASLSVVELASHGPLLRSLADVSHLAPRLRELPGT